MKRLIQRLGLFLLFVATAIGLHAQAPATAQRLFTGQTGTAPGSDVGIRLIGSGVAHHILTWNVSGTVAACTVKVEQSADNAAWSDLITSQSCTTNGQTPVTHLVVNFIRITYITFTGTGSVAARYDGYVTDPNGSGGTVTSISGTGPITTTPNPITGVGTINCLACLTTTTGADRALDNLLNVAINTTLLPFDAGAIDLGSGTLWWQNLFVVNAIQPGDSADSGFIRSLNGASGDHCWEASPAGTDVCIDVDTLEQMNLTGLSKLVVSAPVQATAFNTATNCADSAGAAACGSAAAGAVVVDAGATTVTVSTTAVTANSEILVHFAPDESTRLGITCNPIAALPSVTTKTAATSFVITIPAAPVTNPACYDYFIVN